VHQQDYKQSTHRARQTNQAHRERKTTRNHSKSKQTCSKNNEKSLKEQTDLLEKQREITQRAKDLLNKH